MDKENRKVAVVIDGQDIATEGDSDNRFNIPPISIGINTRTIPLYSYNKASVVTEGQKITVNAFSVYSNENNAYVDKAITEESQI